MIQIGDKLKRKIKLIDPVNGVKPLETPVDATVIFIHPEHRFYTLECKLPGGYIIRETEYFYPRCGARS